MTNALKKLEETIVDLKKSNKEYEWSDFAPLEIRDELKDKLKEEYGLLEYLKKSLDFCTYKLEDSENSLKQSEAGIKKIVISLGPDDKISIEELFSLDPAQNTI